MDAHDAREAADFKQAVLGTAPQQDSSGRRGPDAPARGTPIAAHSRRGLRQGLRPGEGAAIAATSKKTCACLGRGEIGLKSTEIERFESLWFRAHARQCPDSRQPARA